MLLLLRHLRSYHPHKVLQLRLLPQVRRLLPVVRKRVQAQTVAVEAVEAVEAEEAEAVEEGVDEAETAVATLQLAAEVTAEAIQQLPQAVAMPVSPGVVVAAMGPEPVVELEGEVAARVGHSVRFCGSRGICPETSNPYQCEPA
jgi:hypothetical protein